MDLERFPFKKCSAQVFICLTEFSCRTDRYRRYLLGNCWHISFSVHEKIKLGKDKVNICVGFIVLYARYRHGTHPALDIGQSYTVRDE